MLIDVVDNSGVSSMAGELENCFKKFNVARIATASLTRGGLAELSKAIAIKPSLRVKLLVGLYNGHTESAALRRLLALQKTTGGRLEVKIARNPRFHWKVYIFSGHRRQIGYVGSSNLTKDGLGTEGELNVRISSTAGGALASLIETYERTWRKDAILLDEDIAERFAPISKQFRSFANRIHPQLRRVLRRVERPARIEIRKLNKPTSCYLFFDEFAGRATSREVRNKTHWDSKGWNWMVFSSKSERDRVLNASSFYLAEIRNRGGLLSIHDVLDDDEFRTDDGRYFVAYQKRRGSTAKFLNSKTLRLLRKAGFISRKSDLQRNRTLGKRNRLLLSRMLKVRQELE
jgi:HKD family nuclease